MKIRFKDWIRFGNPDEMGSTEKRWARPKRLSAVGLIAAGSMVLAACGGSGSGGSSSPYFEGKTIKMMIPYAAGGGTSEIALIMTKYLTEYIPGHPKVQIINKPAGGSLVGANEFEKRTSSGEENWLLFTSSNLHHDYMFGASGVEFDLSKYEPLLGTPAGSVVYASSSTGVKTAADLANPPKKLVYGGVSYGGTELGRLLSLDILGAKFKFVAGYEGRSDSRVAFEQGETNLDGQSTAAYIQNVEPLVKDGKAVPLYTGGLLDESKNIVRDPAFPDIPSVKEAYESLHGGQDPSGPEWDAYKVVVGYSNMTQKVVWMPPELPKKAKADLQSGIAGMVADDDFKAASAKQLGGYDYQVGKDADAIRDRLAVPSSAVTDFLRDFLKTNYHVDLKNAGA